MTFEELERALHKIAMAEPGERMFKGIYDKPDRWFEDAHWRCQNEHVSKHYVKSEQLGSTCPACRKPVLLTFPEDHDGPLPTGVDS